MRKLKQPEACPQVSPSRLVLALAQAQARGGADPGAGLSRTEPEAPPPRAASTRLLLSGGGSMAAGAAETAAVAVEVGSAQQFEELLRLRAR